MWPMSLRVADHASWRSSPDYSPDAARALRQAYAHLRSERRHLRGYVLAYASVRPYLKRPMARHQHARVAYVMALAHAAAADYTDAIAWIDEALALTYMLDMPGSRVDLLYLRGQCARALLRFRDSAASHRQALGIFRELTRRGELVDTPLEIEILIQLAGTEFFLGEYATVQRRLDEARAIRRRMPVDPVTGVTIEWMEAHLYRWSRQPERALRPASAAAEVYTESGSPASAARIQTFTADVLLDFAASLPYGTARDAQIFAAGEHVALAQALAEEASDEAAIGLTLLSDIRHSRMAGDNVARLALAEEVAHLARRIEDNALLAQALTTIGDELAALGRHDAALSSYARVLDTLEGSEVPALAVWAQSALHHAREQRDDS